MNKNLLVSGVDYFTNDQKINPYYTDDQIDLEKAKLEHETIINFFKQAGINIIQVKPPKNCQDGVYTANWAIVKDGVAIMSNLPNARKLEEPYAKEVLESLNIKCLTLPEDILFSGQGDSLICGKYLLAGSGYRSNPEAQQFVAKTLNLELVQLHTIPELDENGQPVINKSSNLPDSFFYDLDLSIAIIDQNTIAYCPEAFDEPSRAKLEALSLNKIIVSLDEAQNGFACNLVSTGESVIMSNKAPNLKNELEKRGLTVYTPDITELIKGGGYIRCISLALS
jgi:N-dimethylarginine dimethylaminohydrolase